MPYTYEFLTISTFIVGFLGAIQVTVNSRAGSHLGFPILGTVISFGGGWLILLIGIYIEAYKGHLMTFFYGSQHHHRTTIHETSTLPILPQGSASKIVPLSDNPEEEESWSPSASSSSSYSSSSSTVADTVGVQTNPNLSIVASPTLLLPPSPPASLPILRCTPSLRYYHYFPGIFGVMFVTASIVLSSYIGYALFWISAIVGQLTSSAALDHYGFMFPPSLARKPLTLAKVFALFLSMIGAGMSVADRFLPSSSSSSSSSSQVGIDITILCVLIAFGVGCLMPFQATFNRSASLSLPSKLQTTFVSFTMGTVAALIVLFIQLGLDTEKTLQLSYLFTTTEWYMYMGGPLGVIYIASTIWFITILGNSTYFIALVAGQITGSSLLDAIGFLNSPIRSTGIVRGFGILFVICAAILMQEELWRKWIDKSLKRVRT